MIDSFNERERSFEAKFALEQEQKFRIKAHRDRLFGLWAASVLEVEGALADAYASAITAFAVERDGDKGILEKVESDFQAAGKAVARETLLTELAKAEAAAINEIAASSP